MAGSEIEDLLREQAPQVLGAIVRRYGHFDTAEDAVQEALSRFGYLRAVWAKVR